MIGVVLDLMKVCGPLSQFLGKICPMGFMMNPELLNNLRAFYKYSMDSKREKLFSAARADVRDETRPGIRIPEIECT